MSGQGTALPAFLQCDGEWIFENQVFLYREDNTGRQATFTRIAERLDGSFCVGFDSAQLAQAFGISAAALFEANQSRDLIFVGTIDAVPTHGGTSATAYLFRIGEMEAALTVESDQHEGTA